MQGTIAQKSCIKKRFSLCGNVWIDDVMGFGLEQEDGSLITLNVAGKSSPSH